MSREMRRRSRSRSPRRGGAGDFRGKQMTGDNKYVYLSNLPYELRWMELKTLIREKAGEVTFVEIIEQRNGRPKGCALVEFTTIDGAKEAIGKLNGLEIQGRSIVAKDIKNPEAFFRIIKEETGVDFLDKMRTGRPGGGLGVGGIGGPQRRRDSPPRNGGGEDHFELFGLSPQFLKKMSITPPLAARIFTANIAFNATSGNVWDLFAMAGKVTYVDLQIDKEGKSKGQAIVEFSHPLEAVQAISMFHNQKYYDRTLAVKMDRFEKRNQLGKGELPRGLASIGMGLGAGGAPLTDIASVISTMPAPPPPHHHQQQPMQPPPQLQLQTQQQMAPPPQMGLGPPMGGGGGGFKGSDLDVLMGAINGAIGIGGGGGPLAQQQMQLPDMQLQQQQYGGRPPMGGGGGYEAVMGVQQPQQSGAVSYGAAPQQQPGGMTGMGPTGFGTSPVRPVQQQQQQQQSVYGREPVFRDNAPVFGGNPVVNQGGYNATGSSSFNNGSGSSVAPMAGGFIKKEEYAPAYSGAYPDNRAQMGGGGAPFSSRIILIKNLPPDYTWQIVRDRAATFGEVEHCELLTPGMARIRFSLNSEAERARGALAGTSVEGRPITVDFIM